MGCGSRCWVARLLVVDAFPVVWGVYVFESVGIALDQGVGVFVPEGAVVLVVSSGDDAVPELVIFKFLTALVVVVPVLVDAAVVDVFHLVGIAGLFGGSAADGVDLVDGRGSDLIGLPRYDLLIDVEALQDGA